jgi:hypothetical protein
MTSVAGPVRVNARLDTPLSRWLWLLKWLLALPHLVLLALLWIAFAVLSVIAFFAILITGRYPHAIFEFNVGVLRWTWRVIYYSYGALGTDRYPPFTLDAVPDFPATLDIAYPARLSRGLALVKWWLLALPHYLIIAFFVGGGGYAAAQADRAGEPGGWSVGGGLIGLLTLIAGVALLFTGRYPCGVFDLLLGMHRWVLRVTAYAALMTDSYPPFRLDLGGDEPADLTVDAAAPADPVAVAAVTAPVARWTTGRVLTVVLGSVLVAAAFGAVVGGAALLLADRTGRDAEGFLGTGVQTVSTAGHALVLDPVELRGDPGAPDLDAVLGRVRVTATGPDAAAVFVGIGPAADVESYLGAVARSRLTEAGPGRPVQLQSLPGGAPATPPGQQPWSASVSGPGTQQLTWTATQGRWAIVVMNADGTRPVTAAVSAAVTAPALHWVWTGLFLGAGLALIPGVVLVGLALPRRPRDPGTAPLVAVRSEGRR